MLKVLHRRHTSRHKKCLLFDKETKIQSDTPFHLFIIVILLLVGTHILFSRQHRISIQITIVVLFILLQMVHFRSIYSMWQTVKNNEPFPQRTGVIFICLAIGLAAYVLLSEKYL